LLNDGGPAFHGIAARRGVKIPCSYFSVSVWIHRASRRGAEQKSPFRLSVVYHREDDVWKLVHFHSSICDPNEDAIDIALHADDTQTDTSTPTNAGERA
jgi:hypothetical protein